MLYHRPELIATVIVLNYMVALGTSAARIWEGFIARKTANKTGLPFMQEGTVVAPADLIHPPLKPIKYNK